jgi:hypothetical protein
MTKERGFGSIEGGSWTEAFFMATCPAFGKESRMKIANATKLNRKSGVPQWRDLRSFLSSYADSEALMSPPAVWYGC